MSTKGHSPETQAATCSMVERWQAFARDLARTAAPPETDRRGSLRVIGSGLAHVDLTLNDEAAILAADHVFYCLYDRVTQVWIDQLRPDALDLRILYDSGVDRHDTYVCMAEAMLHYVRRGRNVLAIYYGHPGVFATPTHRAIRIARLEGHRATMRPGLSALDHLIADVGFDPMIPGLLSYEASDLLLRRRRLDPALHTVIWQVGTVGEFQFASAGFANHGFDQLLDALEADYGASAEVVHYLAPQYVGIDPLIDRHSIVELRDPTVRAGVSALSTFYLPPAITVPTDPSNAAALHFPAAADGTAEVAYDLATYGLRERFALQRFAVFQAPTHYVSAAPSPGTAFLLRLSRDPELQVRYANDPVATVEQAQTPGLTDRARKLLAIPHPSSFNAAMAEPEQSSAGLFRGSKLADGGIDKA